MKSLTFRDIKKTKPRIHQFKVLQKGQRAFLMVKYSYFITLKNIFTLAISVIEVLKDIFQNFKFVNWWFRFIDVTNRLLLSSNKTLVISSYFCGLLRIHEYDTQLILHIRFLENSDRKCRILLSPSELFKKSGKIIVALVE